MLSKELVEDANTTSVYIAENGPVNQNNAYFEKTGIIVFENKSESDILGLCSEAFGCDVILTLKNDFCVSETQHKQNEHEWKRYNKDTVFVVPSDLSSKTTIQCIPHTLNQEWGKIEDFSLFDNNDIVQFNLEPVPGSIVLFSSTTPWILKEGRVKIYTATRKKKTPHTPMKKTTTTTTTPAPTTPTTSVPSVSSPFEKLRAKHEEIKARIAKLDPRVWSNKGTNATTVQKYESTIHDDSDKKALKNYAKSLATLEDRVAAAEKDTTTLPALLKSLEEIQTILSDTAKMAPLKSATRTRLLNAYEKLSKTQENLVGKTKDIADLLTELQGIEASTTPKTKNSSSSSSKKSVSLQIVVPQIDVDALTPYVIASADGPSGYQAVIRSYMADGSKFQTLVQASNLPELTSLYEKWVEKRKELSTLHQQNVRSDEPPQPLDVTLYVAYGEALRKIFEDTQQQNNPTTTSAPLGGGRVGGGGGGVEGGGVTNSKAVLKNITCSKCESRRKPFNGTTMCRDCWKDDHLEPLIESIEQRADYLSRQVTKEKKQISEGGAMEIDGDNEDGDDDAALDPRGPKEKLYDEYCDINEEIIEATKKFEKPNASESTWEKLKTLLTKADALLPTIPGTIVNEEDDENYEDDEDDMDDFLQRSSESSEASEESEPSDPSGSDSFSSSKKNKSKKRNRNEEDDSLAHRTLLMIHRLPVQSIREDLLKEYSKGHYVLVNERLKSLEDIKEIWGVKITEVREKDGVKKKGIPVILHTYFLEENEAAKHAADFAVDGRSEAETFSKKIEEKDFKKSKKNEEEEED
jgi:hypothetical protein